MSFDFEAGEIFLCFSNVDVFTFNTFLVLNRAILNYRLIILLIRVYCLKTLQTTRSRGLVLPNCKLRAVILFCVCIVLIELRISKFVRGNL